jgi:23S rRNA (cytidine1920-2'-O)/16S rRNA (cytidine1409-2'-O)-methyltransferase
VRADQLLVERGLAASRSQAVRLIAGGLRWRDGTTWRVVGKNRDEVPETAELELVDAAEARYVSRGGLKLEGALAATGTDVQGKRCLDVGQSTGGFTDCLLQRGAEHVVGVDVGHGQLHARIRGDARVTAVEGVNARTLDASAWADASPGCTHFDLIVGDLSFISLTLVLPALIPLLKEAAPTLGTDVSSLPPEGAPASWGGPAARGGELLMLVKPQFELQPGQVGKGGIVRDAALFAVVEQRLRTACAELGLRVAAWFDSPITGGDGNREFFIHAVRENGQPGAGRAPSVEL